jgi:hypothetical protein
MGERRADVLDAEPVDEQLGELEHARGQRGDRALEARVPRPGGEPRIAVAHHRHARRRRRHDDVVVAEDPHEAARERGRLVGVARVGVHLPAARLLVGEVDGVAEALEQGHHRLSGARRQRVVQARDEERDPHAPSGYPVGGVASQRWRYQRRSCSSRKTTTLRPQVVTTSQ